MHTCQLAWSLTLLRVCSFMFVTKEQTGLPNALHFNMREAPTPLPL